jgi:hypothetical protein
MRYLLKNLFLGMLILVVLFLTHITPAWAPDGTRPHPGREAPAGKPTQPTGVSPEERTKEAMGVRGTLTINLISPREIYTNTPQISVSYNLSLSSPLNVRTIPVKVALFLDNQLKNTTEINNFPNRETRRLFISTPAPNQAREYVVTLKAVKADVSNVSLATSKDIYATATQKIKVNDVFPDLVVKEIKCGHGNKVLFTVANISTAPMPSDWKSKGVFAKEGEWFIDLARPISGDITPPGGTASYSLGYIHDPEGKSYTVIVDAKNSITERDESNNSMTAHIKPCEPNLGMRPEFSLSKSSPGTGRVRRGETITVSMLIINYGIPISRDFTVGVYLTNVSPIAYPDIISRDLTTAIRLWQTTIRGLSDRYKEVSATITIPETFTPGPGNSAWIFCVVDDTNQISEADETDNFSRAGWLEVLPR